MKTNPKMKTQLTKAQTLSGLWLALLALMLACLAARAETVIWSDNFDDGLGDNRWFADQGLWQMGSPTVGPPLNAAGRRAFSGTNCATTGLTGNYLATANTRLIRIASFTIPAVDQNPRLRFGHWYSFSSGDQGTVEIKVVGSNTWSAISSSYTITGSGAWTRPSLDLSAYAGKTVQVAFHFVATDADPFNADESTGWYVDDVALVTGTPVFDSPEGFELGLGDWSAERGTWQVGRPTSGPGAAYTGTNCAATVLAGNYAASVDSRLVSPPFVVASAASSPRLRFGHWYSFSSGDQGTVEIKVVGSNTWSAISSSYTITGSGAWTRPSLDLSAYAGKTVQVAFHFVATDADPFNADESTGWYVDDVALVTGTPVFDSPEGFELGLGDWSAERGTWQVGRPTSGPGSAYSGSNCAATVLGGSYAATVNSRLVSPVFTVPVAAASPAVRFRHWHSFSSGDQGTVEIKPVSSNSWTVLATYSSTSGGWSYPFIDLSSFETQPVQIAFHFVATMPIHSMRMKVPGGMWTM